MVFLRWNDGSVAQSRNDDRDIPSLLLLPVLVMMTMKSEENDGEGVVGERGRQFHAVLARKQPHSDPDPLSFDYDILTRSYPTAATTIVLDGTLNI